MELEIFHFKKCSCKLDLIESHIMESCIYVKVTSDICILNMLVLDSFFYVLMQNW